MCDFAYVCACVPVSLRVYVCVCVLASVWRYVFATAPAAGRKYLLNEVAFVSVV